MKTYCTNSIQNLTIEEKDNVNGGVIPEVFTSGLVCMIACLAATNCNYDFCLQACGHLPIL